MRQTLVFVRHGATELNLAGLRCGGDLDVPLADIGRREAAHAAEQVRGLGLPVRVILTSPLRRTHETALVIASALGNPDVVIDADFNERRLGAWNRRPLAETADLLAQGRTPQGGESHHRFTTRIEGAVARMLPRLSEGALLVASRGVARVLGQLLRQHERPIGNGEVVCFDFSAYTAPCQA